MSASEHRLNWFFERITLVVAGISVVVGVLVLLGWVCDLDALKSVFPELTAMKANTSLSFILSGVSLWGTQTDTQGLLIRGVSQVCAGVVLLLSLLTLGEYLSGANFGIDQLLIQEITTLPGDIPGRMAINTSLSFAALGTALLLLSFGKGGVVAIAIHILVMVPIITAVSSLFVYAFSIEEFFRVKLSYTPMAANTAVVLVLLAFGVVNARPDYPFRRLMTMDSANGVTMRHLFPASIGFILLTGWLIQQGYQARYFSEVFALALFTAASIVGLSILTLWNGRMLYEADVQRELSEEARRRASQYARSLIEASLDPLVTISAEGKITDVNEATVQVTGVPRKLLVGSNFSEYFTEPDKASAGYQEAFSKGFAMDFPLALRHVSGKVTEVLYNASLYRNPNGEVGGVVAAARDITRRKKAEQELRISEERLSIITSFAQDAIIMLDEAGNIAFWNKAAERVFGYAREGVLGRNLTMLAPPSFREAHLRGFSHFQQTGQGAAIGKTLELAGLRKDGSEFPLEISLSAVQVKGAWQSIGVLRDITERKQAEQALKRESEKNLALLRNASDGIHILDIEGNIIEVSDSFCAMLGYQRDEMIGMNVSQWDAMFVSSELPKIIRQQYELLARSQFETRHRRKDGTLFDVELSGYPLELDGKPVMFYSSRDITERKLTVEALHSASMYARSLIEASLDPLVTISPEGMITDVNEGSIKVTGVRREELIGTDFSDYFTEPEKAREGYQQVFAKGFVTDYPLTIRHRDGKRTDVLYNASVYKDLAGKVLGVFAAARDVTVQKQAEEELRRYKDHLEEEVQLRTADLVLARNAAEAANRAKSVFLSSMSHELRTPLNAILGFSSMLQRDSLLTESQRENLDIINRSGGHLLTLINDVLEMAKIEAGRVQLENVPLDLGTLVRDVTDMMHVRAQEKGLQLLVDQSSEFPRYIKGDEARLRQVLINLIGNAVKFTLQGGVTVRLVLKPHATLQRLLIEVEDSGIGIKPEDQQNIFEPFVQLDQAATQKGTGLGLTITQQFVQLMGGTINLESTPGKGSTFRVELPVDKVAAADVVKPESVRRGDIAGLASGQPEYRILIVEDQLENQLLLTKLMEDIGFPVKVAENGEQALEIFQSWRPQLIWMDRRMPVMDGVEATRRIRELPGGKEVKIVAVTASAFMEQRDEMLNAGIDDFVRKPYRFNEIYECLTKQLDVQYTYADAQAAEEVSDWVSTAQMLAVLPQDLRRELHDALESLEGERISAVIQRVAAYDSKLHKTLSHLAGNFDYPAILKALQMNQPVNDT